MPPSLCVTYHSIPIRNQIKNQDTKLLFFFAGRAPVFHARFTLLDIVRETMLVLAHKRNASLDFAVQAHLKLNAYPEELLKKYLQATIEKNSGQVLSLPETTTPHKRRKLITDSMPSIPKPSQNFKDRLGD